MPIVTIGQLLVKLPASYAAGTILDEVDAEFMDNLRFKRVCAKLYYLIKRGEIAAEELQAKALALWAEKLQLVNDDDDNDDPIVVEAMTIAREIVTQRMAAVGLPPPKGLDAHAKALVDAVPAIAERARLRVEERYRAASAIIGDTA